MKLNDLENQVLGHTRREMAPTPEDARRVRQALAVQLGAAALGKAAAAGAAGSFWTSLGPIKTALMFVTVIGGGGALLGLVAFAGDAPGTGAAAKPSTSVAAPNREARAPMTPALEPPSAPSASRIGSSSKRSPTTSATANHEQPNRLAEEVRLLKRADQALRQGSPEIARSLLERLATSYPNGQLLEERAATETLLSCQQKRDATALAAARAFLSAHPASVYAARVRAACIDSPTRSEGLPKPEH